MPRTMERASRSLEAQRLKRLRLTLGLSQRELADEMRVGPAAIALWESSARTMPGPALRLLELFEEELGMSELNDDTQAPKPLERISTSWLGRSARLSRGMLGSAVGLAGAAFSGLVQGEERAGELRAVTQAAMARRMASTFGELKGVSMKLGQMLSYLDFAMPPAAREVLTSLQHSSPPLAPEIVIDVFLNEHERTPKQLFAEWSPTPFAAASLGQVHRARLHTGEEVAVKVQYPGIEDAIRADLRNVALMDRLLTTLFPHQDKGALSAELEERLLEECDYLVEADNQEAFASMFADQRQVLVPRVHRALSTKRILVSDFIAGESFADFKRSATQAEKNRAGETLFRVAWQSIFTHGVFNADPHPGNYLFVRDPELRVVLLDFGCVRRYPPEFLALWKRLLRSTMEDDSAEMRRIADAMHIIRDPSRYNFDYHRQMMHALYAPWLTDAPFRFSSEYVTQTWRAMIVDNQNKFRMNMPREWVFANRLQWGLFAVLALLDAEAVWRTTMLDLLYAPGEPRPRPLL